MAHKQTPSFGHIAIKDGKMWFVDEDGNCPGCQFSCSVEYNFDDKSPAIATVKFFVDLIDTKE